MRRFVPFMLLLLLIAAVMRVSFFFTVVYLFAGVYLLTRLWAPRILKPLKIERRFVDRAFPGQAVPVKVKLHNAGWLPIPWLQVHESLPTALRPPTLQDQVLGLGPHAGQQFCYTLQCRQRGYYPIGPLTVRSGDLLGLAPPNIGEVAPDRLIVYPRMVSLERLGLPTRSPFAALPAPSPLFEDPSRVIGVRDYQWGDSPRRIHWTATASAGRVLVKQYRPAIARETLICLDLDQESYASRQRYTATELAIVAAASVANHIIVREGLAVGFATEAHDPLADALTRFSLPSRGERAHLMHILEVLARVQVAKTRPFVDLLRRESARLSWGATVLAITGQESEALFDTLVYLRHAGLAVALILIQPGRPSPELQKRAGLLKLAVHRVWREEDLETWP